MVVHNAPIWSPEVFYFTCTCVSTIHILILECTDDFCTVYIHVQILHLDKLTQSRTAKFILILNVTVEK